MPVGPTLEKLWILRTLLMVLRTAFTLMLLAVLSMSTAHGSPAPTARTQSSAQPAVTSHTSRQTHHTTAVRTGHSAGHGHGVLRGRARNRRTRAKSASLQGTRIAMPPALVGSYESLARQNDKTEDDGLERIEDEDDLADRIARKMLVPVPASASLVVNGDLPESHRYCRPWTARFLSDLAKVHALLFHKPVEVSSAVRTVEYQKRLIETNGNAAAAEGDVVSPHVTGATVDIAKSGLSRQEMAWMRSWLLPLQTAGKIDVEEEFQQACFHITVYKAYVPPKPAVKSGPTRPSHLNNRSSATGQGKPTHDTKLPPANPAGQTA